MKHGTRLDNPTTVSRLDPSGMLSALDTSARMLLDPLLSLPEPRTIGKTKIDNLVFIGMGGSALTGDVISDWLGDRVRIPINVVREEKLPGYVSRRSIVVALSYSGETLETLTAFERARRRHSIIVGLGSGGRLKRLCDRYSLPFYQVRPSVAPRAALFQMVSASSNIVENYGLGEHLKPELNVGGRELEGIRRECAIDVDTSRNRAKKLALRLSGKVPVIYALSRMSSVARRFKNQVNENSKQQARYEPLPEAGHNDIEAWAVKNHDFVPIIVRDSQESTLESRFLDSYKTTLSTRTTVSEARVRTRSRLGRLLGPILMLDYVSVYLAFLNGVDPAETNMIKRYRELVRLGRQTPG